MSDYTDPASPSRAAIYGRVSTAEQVDGTSLDTQRHRCRAYVETQGLTLKGEYFDEGVSGAKASRPQLDAVMAAARSGDVDVIVVLKLDRFGRSTRHLTFALGELDDLGVRFVSVAEAFDSSTPTGRLHRNILGSFAEFERDQIRERTMSGLRAVAEGGYWPGGPPPYGFQVVEDGHRKRLELDDDEAGMLRTAVTLVVDEGATTAQAAQRLNALGHKTRTGRRWTHHTLRRTLLDANLSGTWTYARRRSTKQAAGPAVTVSVPTIIEPERHEQLRAALRTTATTRTANRFYLLSRGMVRMPCGGRGYGTHRADRGYAQYVCENRRYNAAHRCTCVRINVSDVDTVVWDAIVGLLSEPDRLVAMARDYLGARPEQMRVERDQVAAVERKIDKLERVLNSKVGDYLREGVDAKTVRAATRDLEADLQDLRAHLETLRAWQDREVDESDRMRRLWEIAKTAHVRLHAMTPEEQRRVLELLDVTVRVGSFGTCPRCDGSGRIPGGRGKLGGHTCPVCKGSRAVPTVEVEGRVRDGFLTTGVGAHDDTTGRRSRCC